MHFLSKEVHPHYYSIEKKNVFAYFTSTLTVLSPIFTK